ncbi:helix-turn-helix domain-containing protein [Streptomyces zagrosensis]|uniref:Transcriptional regulator with XRE-family HTH domain n=1 Tax=Streptomyces zagrosensis TaxID=1042984 RepID=A0A7W9QGY7_9ACTN|nr:helix-turn-helix transcriptional regulator [Streptomyces zagrosensis]MBB5940085.1 transcriptional regulator with XRE-family HTH domain [Streptomyces zagrosensis]
MHSDAEHIETFAAWVEGLMREQGYDIDSPRGGGKSRLAVDAGVHRAAVTRLLQRQSMPDLDTMRGLSKALRVPVREVLIRSGRLTEDDLPSLPGYAAEGASTGHRMSAEQAADAMGVPAEMREVFVRVAEQFTPRQPEDKGLDIRATG